MSKSGSPLEWVIATLGGLFIVATLVFLTVIGLTTPDGPPEMVVVVDRVQAVEGGYVVMFTTENRGGATGTNVTIEGTLTHNDGVVETAQTTIDFVPERSGAEGGLFFAADPASGTLVVRALGYAAP